MCDSFIAVCHKAAIFERHESAEVRMWGQCLGHDAPLRHESVMVRRVAGLTIENHGGGRRISPELL